ncbi:OLC1v1011597C1 [Oldenlandia corymbosa var. corymbosa]|uniref:OLC1v1011597C1 n=1 Tax=Oldenlandia corymbosa var. corymbosa TaxID=529605 RepID=A0AAV1DU04_OLDCO|nr:OLC1v1011597C1 [Oldenlandia corymbosa var. corymbosa]
MAFFLSKMQSAIHHSIIRPRGLLSQRFTCSVVGTSESYDAIVSSISDSLSKGLNWESLSQKFIPVQLTESLVQKVLLHLKEPIKAKQALKFFHWSAHHTKSRHGISSYCLAIHIFAKAKLVKDAKALIESILAEPCEVATVSGMDSKVLCVLDSLIQSYEIVDSGPLSFDLFMQTCARLKMIDNILDACKILDEHGFGLSVISYNTLLHVMQKSEKTYLVWSLYEHMIEKRMFPNEVTYRIMVSTLGKEGRLQWCLNILERINGKRCTLPGVVVNTYLVLGMIEEGRSEDGLLLLKWMMLKNMILDTVSFSLCVVAKVRMGDLDDAWEVYEEMRRRGFEGNSFVNTSFIRAYCKQGRIKEAIELVQEMDNLEVKPYDETFNHLIEGCARAGYWEESLKFCERMIKVGLVPSSLAFNEMAEKLCSHGETRRADEILTMLLEKGFVPDEDTYSHLAEGYLRLGNVESILKLYYEMEHRSIVPSPLFFTCLITCLCQNGRVKEAEEYLIPFKANSLALPLHVYEMLIASYLEKGENAVAQQLSEEMVRNSLRDGL